MSTDTERNLSERQKEEWIAQAEFEQYAKEHEYIISTTNIIEQIRDEIASLDTIMLNDNPKKVSAYVKLSDVREVIDKYR